jgi:hypothetical protein
MPNVISVERFKELLENRMPGKLRHVFHCHEVRLTFHDQTGERLQ